MAFSGEGLQTESFRLTVNGDPVVVEADPDTLLLSVLRETRPPNHRAGPGQRTALAPSFTPRNHERRRRLATKEVRRQPPFP